MLAHMPSDGARESARVRERDTAGYCNYARKKNGLAPQLLIILALTVLYACSTEGDTSRRLRYRRGAVRFEGVSGTHAAPHPLSVWLCVAAC